MNIGRRCIVVPWGGEEYVLFPPRGPLHSSIPLHPLVVLLLTMMNDWALEEVRCQPGDPFTPVSHYIHCLFYFWHLSHNDEWLDIERSTMCSCHPRDPFTLVSHYIHRLFYFSVIIINASPQSKRSTCSWHPWDPFAVTRPRISHNNLWLSWDILLLRQNDDLLQHRALIIEWNECSCHTGDPFTMTCPQITVALSCLRELCALCELYWWWCSNLECCGSGVWLNRAKIYFCLTK